MYLQFPYPFPELEDIEWDYETFLQKIYRKVWQVGNDCGNMNIFNKTDSNYKKFDLEGIATTLENGNCKPASVTDDSKSKYTFDINISFKSSGIISDSDIEFIQDIWIPLLPKDENKNKNKLKAYQRPFSFAFCKANNNINKNSFSRFIIFNGLIKVSSFYDEVYIKQNNKTSIISLYISLNDQNKDYITLSDKDQGIICPNQPLFKIENKDSISMGLFYKETNKYTFFIRGTLSNGYYVILI